MNDTKKMKLVRISPGCCGMIEGHIYDAEVDGSYARIYLDEHSSDPFDTETFRYLSSPHWMPGFFRVVEEGKP